MDEVEKLARGWRVSERWIRATLDGLGLEVQQLRELGEEDIAIHSPFTVVEAETESEDLSEWLDP